MTVQEQVDAWRDKQPDMIVCKRHGNVQMKQAICQVRYDAVIKHPIGHGLTDKQKRLREEWSGCRDCDQITVSPYNEGEE